LVEEDKRPEATSDDVAEGRCPGKVFIAANAPCDGHTKPASASIPRPILRNFLFI
jgi:hypothetical protein